MLPVQKALLTRRFNPANLRPRLWLQPDFGHVFQGAGLTTPATATDHAILSMRDMSPHNQGITASATQGTLLKVAFINGKNVLYRNAAGTSELDVTFTSIAQPYTIVMTVRRDVPSGNGDFMFDDINNSGRVILGHGFSGLAGDKSKLAMFAGTELIASGDNPFNGLWAVYRAVFNGTASTLHVNGTLQLSGSAGTNALVDIKFFNRFSNTDPLTGYTRAILVFDRILAPREAMLLDRYLAADVGVSL